MSGEVLVANWGFGVNSTGMIIGMVERGIRPTFVIAADTGDEKPETYKHADEFIEWMAAADLTSFVVSRGKVKVRKAGRKIPTDAEFYSTLEENCLVNKTLPSIAFGMKGCSQKWKREPIEKFEKSQPMLTQIWESLCKVRKAIGYDAGEERRARIKDDDKYTYWYPLIEWGWYRKDCVAAIERAGLKVPCKSACFYCPSMKKHEILALRKEHPDLYARAIAMEDNAMPNLGTVKGLGRSFSWRDVQEKPCLPVIEQVCMCYDDGE